MPNKKKAARKKPRSSSLFSPFNVGAWPPTWTPDVKVAEITTKLGEPIKWESMGLGARGSATRHGRHVNYQPRYPRAFECTLTNNARAGDNHEAFYDLYDIGIQRATEEVEVRVTQCTAWRVEKSSDFPTAMQGTVSGDMLTVPPGDYQPGGANNTVILRFTGATCVLQVIRAAAPKKLTRSGDGDGSPPPPDPGNGKNEESFIGTPKRSQRRKSRKRPSAK